MLMLRSLSPQGWLWPRPLAPSQPPSVVRQAQDVQRRLRAAASGR
jgi:hypothetical protein